MFFKRKTKNSNESAEYFKYRDSLTGCMNQSCAIKNFDKFKSNILMGGVLIRLRDVENMPVYKGEELIKETGVTITNIYSGDIYRLKWGDFLIFTHDCKAVADKINYFLNALSDEKHRYAVGAQVFDEHEKDYSVFMHRLYRAVKVAEGINGKSAIY